MKFVIQRVNYAKVSVEGDVIGKIDKGLLVLLGAGKNDENIDEKTLSRLADKIINMRIFSDENDKINLSLENINGGLLIVSQFTLYADCKKGNRPSFFNALRPDRANELYEQFIDICKKKIDNVQTGSFGAYMKIAYENDGPFTIVLDSDELGL